MDELKLELDACCKRLDAKYQAVAILKKQAEAANTDLQTSEKKFYENSKRLEKEVSKLQFELEWKESSFIDSQQTWAERFDRVCRDNALLMSKLEARNEELRRTIAHKSAIARERDELLALLDVTERLRYEQGKSMIAEEEYGSFSSTELAVLGACKCRGANPEPCGCAHAAANLRKEVAKLREEIKETNKRRQEAYLTVDAYRLAFEEQMAKSRQMSHELATVSTLTSRSAKAKAAMKFLLKSLSDDDDSVYSTPSASVSEDVNITTQDASVMSLQELVQALTDVVREKEDALAQQKVAAQVLANKLEMLEKMIPKNLQDTYDFHNNKNKVMRQESFEENTKHDISKNKTITHDDEANHSEEKEIIISNGELNFSLSDLMREDQQDLDEDDSCSDEIYEEAYHDLNRNEKEGTSEFTEEVKDSTNIQLDGIDEKKAQE